MSAYYNEIDPFAAQWLRNLIAAGHIAPGDVDERSITDVSPDDLSGYTQCHFFAGVGVWSYSLRFARWADDEPVWTGSCPCQPFSTAGRGDGAADPRHLWPAWFKLIRQLRPAVCFGEQVASKDGLAWLDLVHSDLEAAGYAVGALDICAAGFGAPHIRQRIYFVGDSGKNGYARSKLAKTHISENETRKSYEPAGEPSPSFTNGFWKDAEWLQCRDGKARATKPGIFPLAHGASARVGRLRAYGNAIVAPQAAEFIRAYREIANA